MPPLRDTRQSVSSASAQLLGACRSTGQLLGQRCGTNPKLEVTRHKKTPY